MEVSSAMLKIAWKQFQSGTDIRGVATEGVPGQEVNLTGSAVRRMAAGYLLWLSNKTGKPASELTVAVGHDSRISADRIQKAVVDALLSAGVRVLVCGLASTPSMFMITVDWDCDGSIQITASHHPYYRNGLKFFTKEGGLDGSDIDEILAYAAENKAPAYGKGVAEMVDYMSRYSEILRDKIKQGVNAEDYEHPLAGFHIVVDAGNGAGGFYATDVLAPLGADISGSQFLEPDGMFPNHIPNPENAAAMDSVRLATIRAKADLGVIFDTDVDRGGAVDARGDELNRNRLVAVASAIALEGNEGGTIVTDSITSSGLKEYIENTLGGRHHRFKRGYRNVINEAIRLNNEGVNCPLAIETSGHAALRENYFLDDGAYLVTKIIIKMAVLRREGKTLETLLEGLREPVEATELRLPITASDFRACGEAVIAGLEQWAEQHGWAIAPDNREGIRVSFGKDNGDGWFLLRLSVHDPIMPLNIESDSEGGVRKMVEQLHEYLLTCEGLDISPVTKFLA